MTNSHKLFVHIWPFKVMHLSYCRLWQPFSHTGHFTNGFIAHHGSLFSGCCSLLQ